MANTVNLNDLPLPQLLEVRQQIDEEVQVLTQSFIKLRQAQQVFLDCMESLKKLSNSEALVPLTNSLYVDAQIIEPEKVIVDIGTGYFVEKVFLFDVENPRSRWIL